MRNSFQRESSNKDREKYYHIVKRLKLKRQTKLLCTLSEKWNNMDDLTKLFFIGVDGVEIFSELDYTIKEDLIKKIRAISKENNQYIPIIHNLSYYKTFINSIYSFNRDKNSITEMKSNNQIVLTENQSIYFFKNKEESSEFFQCNKTEESLENEEKYKKLSSTIINREQPVTETKIIYHNLPDIEDEEKEKAKYLLDSIPENFESDLKLENKEKVDNLLIIKNSTLRSADYEGEKITEIEYNNKIITEIHESKNDEEEDNKIVSETLQNMDLITFCTDPPLKYNNLEISDMIHINFGELTLSVEEKAEKYIKCRCINSGTVKLGHSFSVEAKDHFLSDLIENDENKLLKELRDSINLGIDFVIVSILTDPNKELEKIKGLLKEAENKIKIIVKIDNPNSINYFDNYADIVDAIVFSRNDLNIKDSLCKICFNQKNIVSKCGYLGIPIIISGTFLETMKSIPNPIRAEISDLYNTILLGIDCLLLTSEIIEGMYPFEVIETINEICSCCEKRVDYSNLFLEVLYKSKKPMKIAEAIASSTVKTSFNLQAPYIICMTEKGNASVFLSKYRPFCPVITFTNKTQVAYNLSIFRGVFTIIFEEVTNMDATIAFAKEFLLKNKLILSNTNIVLLSGINEVQNGTTDQMRVINILDH